MALKTEVVINSDVKTLVESTSPRRSASKFTSHPEQTDINSQRIGPISLPLVVDQEFKEISLSQYRGYVVLFFYPWISPSSPRDRRSVTAADFATVRNPRRVRRQQFSHLAWIQTPQPGWYCDINYPLSLTSTRKSATPSTSSMTKAKLCGVSICRSRWVIVHATINNLPVGRNVDETPVFCRPSSTFSPTPTKSAPPTGRPVLPRCWKIPRAPRSISPPSVDHIDRPINGVNQDPVATGGRVFCMSRSMASGRVSAMAIDRPSLTTILVRDGRPPLLARR